MPYSPQGLEKLRDWRRYAGCHVVAIGGISKTNIQGVAATGVAGIALISCIMQASDPCAELRDFLAHLSNSPSVAVQDY